MNLIDLPIPPDRAADAPRLLDPAPQAHGTAPRDALAGHLLHRPTVRRLALSALLLACVLAGVFSWAWQAAPSTANLPGWVHAQDALHGVPYTSLAAISPDMIHAIIASEDERFFSHHGLDTIGLLRAAWDDLRAGRFVEGGSTLTAQLAKNVYLNGNDHTIPLKLKDLLLALKIEHRYSKAQILELYLNLVYYGEGAHGIGAASARYFGIAPAHLDIAQGALLAGLVQAPGTYDPFCHPNLARLRQGQVLTRMQIDGYITVAQENAARRETFAFWMPGATPPHDAYCPA